jgi:hypothetical protein
MLENVVRNLKTVPPVVVVTQTARPMCARVVFAERKMPTASNAVPMVIVCLAIVEETVSRLFPIFARLANARQSSQTTLSVETALCRKMTAAIVESVFHFYLSKVRQAARLTANQPTDLILVARASLMDTVKMDFFAMAIPILNLS